MTCCQGFHGSPAKNWHSVRGRYTAPLYAEADCFQIIRHGLWFKEIAHGRAYGNGKQPVAVHILD